MNLAEAGPGRELIFAEGPRADQYMARTARHKLLLCRDSAQSQFFDLQEDPLELHNRIDDPAYAMVVATLEAALMQWALFDHPSVTHLDPDAPVIEGANVPRPGDGHAADAIRYFRERMSESP
jgi:hypothetical protein